MHLAQNNNLYINYIHHIVQIASFEWVKTQNPFQSPTLKIVQGLFFHNHHLSLYTFNIRDHLEEMSPSKIVCTQFFLFETKQMEETSIKLDIYLEFIHFVANIIFFQANTDESTSYMIWWFYNQRYTTLYYYHVVPNGVSTNRFNPIKNIQWITAGIIIS